MYLLVTGFYAFLSHLDYLYAAVAAYLCGCFNGALFTSRLFFHDDVRTHGSGNAGLTNFYRTYGARYALLVIACDMLKAVAAVSLAAWLGARFDPRMLPDLPLTAAEQAEYVLHFKYWAGFFCVVGHMFPCTAKFRGGKGILCSATLTLLLDCLKGAICVLIARPLIASVGYGFPVSIMAPGAAGDWMLGVICLAAVWGHIFSPYLNFHGGKGIAVGLGVILAWYWPIGLSLLGMFIVAVAITKFVSVGSLAAAIGLPIAACAVFPYSSLGLKFCMAIIGITVVWAHRANIKKLMTGKESKLSFTKRVTEPDDK